MIRPFEGKSLAVPPPRPASALYSPWIRRGSELFISGQVSGHPEIDVKGIVGRDLTPEDGAFAARLCGLNLVAQMLDATGGDLSRIERIVRVTAYVSCAEDFDRLPIVADGCSAVLIETLGRDRGLHSRTSVGVLKLPWSFAVECDAVVELSVGA